MLWMLKWKKIRQATQIVAGNLTYKEKMKLIELLNKLNEFHHPIFTQNIENFRTAGQRY